MPVDTAVSQGQAMGKGHNHTVMRPNREASVARTAAVISSLGEQQHKSTVTPWLLGMWLEERHRGEISLFEAQLRTLLDRPDYGEESKEKRRSKQDGFSSMVTVSVMVGVCNAECSSGAPTVEVHPSQGHTACFGMAWDYRRSSLSGASGWQDIN